jgi:WASH complex subunit strumpellin
MKKVEKLMLPLLKSIRRIGQTQLIRRQIAYLLQFECQLDAFQLHQSLLAFDRGLMNDITNHYRNPEKPYPDPATGNPLLFETTSLLEACGLDDPLQKIYVTSVPLEGLPQLLFLFLLTYIPKVVTPSLFLL